MNKHFDVIIAGAGSMGSPACYYLAKQGYRVLGIEQFSIPHDLGSHAGQSRIIRKAYFEHPGYVPLLQRAYQNWNSLQQETGEQVYYKTGLLYAGPVKHEIITGVQQSASLNNISLERIDPAKAAGEFPRFHFPGTFEILLEPDAGFVTPEKAIRLYSELANRKGAVIHTHEKIMNWKNEGAAVVVETDKDRYRCDKLIITAGAWAGKMIPGLSDKIKVTRQLLAWVKPDDPAEYSINHFPCWMIADEKMPGCFYGFPYLNSETAGPPAGLKLAYHYAAAPADPDHADRQPSETDRANLKYCLHNYLPGIKDEFISVKTCLYANSPDENFIIGCLPGTGERVIIACGFSGHGFKFASVVGELLTELAISGKTTLPIDFLSVSRFFIKIGPPRGD